MDQKQSSSKTSKSKQDKSFSTTSAREDLASITSSSTSRNEDEEPPTNDLLMKEKNILDQKEQLLDGSTSSEAEDSDQDQRASGSKRPRSQEQKKLDRILANRRSARRSRERRKQLQENLEKSVLLLQKQNEKLSQENSSLKNDLNFLLSLLSNDRKITELPSSRAAIQQQLLQQTSSTSHQSQLDLQQELLLQLANQQRYQQALSVGNINQNNGVKGITANQFSTILADATRTSTTTQQQGRNHQNTTLDPTSLLFHANNRF
ncbi:predicted protein [Chaetoceros tenuissimus]|uniref:BZIP domain-containing protein n=1 Tax=Chaetoceros tenuissimus TaxID=426638 RepID=A0AAD3HF92_9STRA|nr:predicted protein [Chaetoceros tenuissimus]